MLHFQLTYPCLPKVVNDLWLNWVLNHQLTRGEGDYWCVWFLLLQQTLSLILYFHLKTLVLSVQILTCPWVVVQLKPRFWDSRPQSIARRWTIKAVCGDGKCGSDCSHTQTQIHRHVSKNKNLNVNSAHCYACVRTWLWMLRRFTRKKSQGRMDLRGAKVCKGGMPRLLGRTGNANTSWFRMALVMWLSIDGKLVVVLSLI